MVDLRADTASSSDKAEFTETEDQSRTHQLYIDSIEYYCVHVPTKV